jgi:hypothetical protein
MKKLLLVACIFALHVMIAGAAVPFRLGVPGDSFTTREVVFEWRGQPFKEPVWCDLMTGWVYEIPQENQIVHADGITFVRIPAYDSPCFVAERCAVELDRGEISP